MADVSYRLQRQATVASVRSGSLSRSQVCDPHPQLVRAAREVGEQTDVECPICEETCLVHVTYVFGPRLPRHGRCISYPGEVAKLSKRSGTFVAYVVECCNRCGWNHLVRRYPLPTGGDPVHL